MSITVEILNEQDAPLSEHIFQLIEGVLQTAAHKEGITKGEVAVTLVDDEQIRQLNAQYRQKDKPTDVLSFPLEEEDALGDIIVSIPRAKEQARDFGHTVEREIGFLVVHGFLHLLGYDHQTEEDEKEMMLHQEMILDEYGLFR